MAIQRFNAVGGYSTGITGTAVIDDIGNITGVGATFSGLIRANAGISAAGGTLSSIFNIPIEGMTLQTVTQFGNDRYIRIAPNQLILGTLSTPSSNDVIKLNYSTIVDGSLIPSYYGVTPLRVKGPTSNTASITDWLEGTTLVSSIMASGGFSGPASNFSGLIRANAGISASGATFSGNVRLQNGEFLQNTTNGRTDIMPGPAGATHYGLFIDHTWNNLGFGIILGTVRSSDGALNTSNVLFSSPLSIGSNTRFNLTSDSSQAFIVTSTGNDTLQLGIRTNSSTYSGAFALIDDVSIGAANRSPGVTHSNPNFYIYANGSARANDFIRMEHDGTVGRIVSGGTSGILLQPGSGVLGISGGISAAGGTFINNIQANGYILTSNARSWFL